MDEKVMSVALSNGQYLQYWFSDNEAMSEGCDACIGYSIVKDKNTCLTDGGEMDYSTDSKSYNNIKDALFDVINFAFDSFNGFARILDEDEANNIFGEIGGEY